MKNIRLVLDFISVVAVIGAGWFYLGMNDYEMGVFLMLLAIWTKLS